MGLQNVREITSDDASDLFSATSHFIRKQTKSKPFSWALCYPLEHLGNKWTTPAVALAVDGSHYLPLTHPSSRGHGTDRKRLVLCVEAHVSPIWAKIFEFYFAASLASGRKKRYRPKDPFKGAENMGGKTTKKQRRASDETAEAKKARTAAANAARLRKAQARDTKWVAGRCRESRDSRTCRQRGYDTRGNKSLRGTWCQRGRCSSFARSSA